MIGHFFFHTIIVVVVLTHRSTRSGKMLKTVISHLNISHLFINYTIRSSDTAKFVLTLLFSPRVCGWTSGLFLALQGLYVKRSVLAVQCFNLDYAITGLNFMSEILKT